jgi:hypothetical protein
MERLYLNDSNDSVLAEDAGKRYGVWHGKGQWYVEDYKLGHSVDVFQSEGEAQDMADNLEALV